KIVGAHDGVEGQGTAAGGGYARLADLAPLRAVTEFEKTLLGELHQGNVVLLCHCCGLFRHGLRGSDRPLMTAAESESVPKMPFSTVTMCRAASWAYWSPLAQASAIVRHWKFRSQASRNVVWTQTSVVHPENKRCVMPW